MRNNIIIFSSRISILRPHIGYDYNTHARFVKLILLFLLRVQWVHFAVFDYNIRKKMYLITNMFITTRFPEFEITQNVFPSLCFNGDTYNYYLFLYFAVKLHHISYNNICIIINCCFFRVIQIHILAYCIINTIIIL